MIAGIGCDLLDMRRLQKMIARRPRLPERLLSEDELREYQLRRDNAAYLGGRVAAKEALSKALGIGMRAPLTWRRLSVLTDNDGAPMFRFAPPLQKYMQQQGITNCHVSISHDGDFVSAVVVAEKTPNA